MQFSKQEYIYILKLASRDHQIINNIPAVSGELGLPAAAMSVELKDQERSWCDSKKPPVDAENLMAASCGTPAA